MSDTKLARVATPVVAAIAGVEKAQVKVGDAVLAAASKIGKDEIKPLCDAIQAQLVAKGFTEGSAKVTTMYVRRVLTAVIEEGVTVEPGQTLRGLYAGLKKNATGGAAHKRGAKLPNPAEDDADGDAGIPASPSATQAPTTLESRAEKVKQSVVMIFGYQEPDLLDAVAFAAANTAEFVRWAQAAAQAAAMAEIEKVATKAAPRRRTRAKAEAATA